MSMSTFRTDRGKSILENIARRVMIERGFLVDYSKDALNELKKISVYICKCCDIPIAFYMINFLY